VLVVDGGGVVKTREVEGEDEGGEEGVKLYDGGSMGYSIKMKEMVIIYK